MKFQITNIKFQTSSNSQIPHPSGVTSHFSRLRRCLSNFKCLVLGNWNLEFVWSVEFGTWNFGVNLGKILRVILFSFILLKTTPATACECAGDVSTPQKKFHQSKVVFVGTVANIDRQEDEAYVEFNVSRDYKGNLGRSVLINTVAVGSLAAVCGYEFRVGGKYLIYGYGSGTSRDDVYMTEGCASVKEFDCAKKDLSALENIATVREVDLDDAQISLGRDHSYFFRTTYDFDYSQCDDCYPKPDTLEK